MNRRILIIAFHFPPIASSSGMQRALKFVRYLREDGWRPVVLTATPGAYDRVNDSQLAEIPDDVPVQRAFAMDARRRFSVRGRYPGFLAWPDPWLSWWPGAVFAGRRIIRRHRPSAIWSTFPINTTNLVAGHLAGWSGLPWIADLRDPITVEGYPPDAMRFRLARGIERRTMARASRVVFTADYTRKLYIERYPDLAGKDVLIPNGFDEANFPTTGRPEHDPNRPLTILHSGGLQPKGRHPGRFIEAVGRLKANRKISPETVRIVLRASGYESQYEQLVADNDVADIVSIVPPVPYEAAIAEMVEADALLVFQGTAYNNAVPAKLYEYFYAGKPILGILDKQGETQRVLAEVGITDTAAIDDVTEIENRLADLVATIGSDSPFLADPARTGKYSRRKQSLRLSALLEEVVKDRKQTDTANER